MKNKTLASIKGTKSKSILVILVLFLSIQSLTAQGWRFPDCNDLTVTKIEQSLDNSEQLLITVFNDCDTCRVHVYTGLKVYRNREEIVAVEDELYTKPNPENNGEYEYILIKRTDFEITNDLRVEMVEICDTLPLSMDILNPIANEKLEEFTITIDPNPTVDLLTIKADNSIEIERVSVINSQGQLIIESSTVVSQLDLKELMSGLYFLEMETNKGKFVKKIIKK